MFPPAAEGGGGGGGGGGPPTAAELEGPGPLLLFRLLRCLPGPVPEGGGGGGVEGLGGGAWEDPYPPP